MKKILIISEVPTHKTNAGNRSCILSYCKMLKNLGYDVYFLFYYGYGFNKLDIDETRFFLKTNFFEYKLSMFSTFKRIFYYYYRFKIQKINYYKIDDLYPSGIENVVKDIILQKNISVVITNYVWTSKIFSFLTNIKKILYTHDMFSNRFENTGMSFFSTSKIEEGKALERADTIISIQENETFFFKNITSKKVVTGFSPSEINILPFANNENILFFGGANQLNIDAVNLFVKNVFSEIIKKNPAVKLLIGGSISSVLNFNNDTNIELLGYFKNIENFYKLGDIVINPVFSGTGLKIKTIEALSHAKLVVASSHSVQGLFDQKNVPIVEIKNDQEYIENILDLLSNKDIIKEYHKKSVAYMRRYNLEIQSVFVEAINK